MHALLVVPIYMSWLMGLMRSAAAAAAADTADTGDAASRLVAIMESFSMSYSTRGESTVIARSGAAEEAPDRCLKVDASMRGLIMVCIHHCVLFKVFFLIIQTDASLFPSHLLISFHTLMQCHPASY